jgi:DNA-3-methyladenine glycosylase II
MILNVVQPYDFALSLRVMKSFQPAASGPGDRLRLAARIAKTPSVIEVGQRLGAGDALEVSSNPPADRRRLRLIAERVLFAELDLKPFYPLTARDPKLAVIARGLRGLKPMRPASLFEMAVITVTEQQISMAAAGRIRARVAQRFGERAGDQWVFPEPGTLAKASPKQLQACGLSSAKALYIHDLAAKIAGKAFDLEALRAMKDDEAREAIMSLRGFGPWSADYILVRGLARPDAVPVDDLGVRSVVGTYLGNGRRASALEVARKLEPFRPYRGLAAFYLLAEHRLDSSGPGG